MDFFSLRKIVFLIKYKAREGERESIMNFKRVSICMIMLFTFMLIGGNFNKVTFAAVDEGNQRVFAEYVIDTFKREYNKDCRSNLTENTRLVVYPQGDRDYDHKYKTITYRVGYTYYDKEESIIGWSTLTGGPIFHVNRLYTLN